MAHDRRLWATALVSSLLYSGAVMAQQPIGQAGPAAGNVEPQGPIDPTSGPAAGTNVVPSTVMQKAYEGGSEGRSAAGEAAREVTEPNAPAAAAGMPGAEGLPGTQSGPDAK